VPAAAAAALILAGAAVTVWVSADSEATPTRTGPSSADPGLEVLEAAPSVVPPMPDGVLAPAGDPPEGLVLVGATWDQVDGVAAGTLRSQLFTVKDLPGAALLLELQPTDGGTGGGTRVEVRGVEATTMAHKDRPADATTISWTERGAAISASYLAMSETEAIAALKSLAWRDDTWTAGFEPGDGSTELAGDAELPAEPRIYGTFHYRPTGDKSTPGLDLIELRTAAATGGATPGTLDTRFFAGLDDAGGGEEPGDGVATAWDGIGWLSIAHPDGTEVDVMANHADRDRLAQLAAAVAPRTAAELTDLWTQANDHLVALPIRTEVALPSSTLTRRGPDRADVLCLQVDAGTACSGADGDDGLLTASFLVGETWVVIAASTDGDPVVSRSAGPGDEPLPGETGADGDWRVAVVAPPDDARSVQALVDGDGADLPRPDLP
jgi:hypothetical protein